MKHNFNLVLFTLVLVSASAAAAPQALQQDMDWRTADLQASKVILDLDSTHLQRQSARSAWRALKRTADCSGNMYVAQTLQALKAHLDAPYEIGMLRAPRLQQ